jgi:hypothetical protein
LLKVLCLAWLRGTEQYAPQRWQEVITLGNRFAQFRVAIIPRHAVCSVEKAAIAHLALQLKSIVDILTRLRYISWFNAFRKSLIPLI